MPSAHEVAGAQDFHSEPVLPPESFLSHLSRFVADTLLPPVCAACQQQIASRNAICPECWREIDFIAPPLCDRLGIRLPYATGDTMISAAAAARPPAYGRARAVGHYDGTLRRLVHSFKFRDRLDLAPLFGTWLVRSGAELVASAEVVVPVPLSRLRLLQRRFNQAALLAHEIGRNTGLPVRSTGLRRVRRTPTQVGLTAEQRRLNVRGAFAVPASEAVHLREKRVLLIDDVITTGATAEACTRTLLKAGASSVDVLAVALVADPLRVTT